MAQPGCSVIDVLEGLGGLWLLLFLLNFGAVGCHRLHQLLDVFAGVLQNDDASDGQLSTHTMHRVSPLMQQGVLHLNAYWLNCLTGLKVKSCGCTVKGQVTVSSVGPAKLTWWPWMTEHRMLLCGEAVPRLPASISQVSI